MKNINFEICHFSVRFALILVSAFGAVSISAQDHPQSAPTLADGTAMSKRIAAEHRGVLSAATNNVVHLAESGAARHINSSPSSNRAAQQLLANRTSRLSDSDANLVPVNDTGFDFGLSRLAGFSQNGSSAFLAGEPVIVCSGNDFYYASLFQFQNSFGQFVSAVGVNRSTNGGDTWSHPIPAVRKSADTHIIDKQWLAIDPNKPTTLYLSFTDFDYTFHKLNGCGGAIRIAIELTSSNNNGLSWTAPVTVDQLCNPAKGHALQASQVLIGNAGEIFVAYVAETSLDEQIIFRRSTDGGLTFSDSTSVAGAVLAGLGGAARLQSLIQTNSFPSLSIDRSQGASRGTLYLTWTDASRHQIHDFLAPTQTYGFGEVLFSKSTDQGRTWTPAAPVRSTAAHRDQFLPSAAVDRDGTLAICYFDRRNDPQNNGVDHYCSVSHDQGASFTHLRNTPTPFTPTHLTDGLMDPVNFGDYDVVSSDATGGSAGFFSTFQTQSTGDANIVGVRF
jgi:hypothetical protein